MLRTWMPRLVLLAVGLLYVMIGTKFALSPDASAAASGLGVAAPVGRTTLRAAMGGFPLGIAIALLYCLLSPARIAAGLRLAATVTGVVLAVRLAGASADGALAESAHLLAPETVVVALTLAMSWLVNHRPVHPTNEGRDPIRLSAE